MIMLVNIAIVVSVSLLLVESAEIAPDGLALVTSHVSAGLVFETAEPAARALHLDT